MKPTAHLRWAWREADAPLVFGGGLVVGRQLKCVLEQFWEIAPEEADITIAREAGPDGVEGRWKPLPEVR